MYTDDDLESALQAGVLTDDNVAAFRAHVAQRHHAVAVDEESFRLVSSFNDIFVVIACAMLLLSIKWIGTTLGQPGLGAAAIATSAWLLAEFFVRRRHMALPAIVLLLAFVASVFSALTAVIGTEHGQTTAAIAAGGTAVAAYLHWRRFQVPITVAAGTAAVALMLTLGLITSVVGGERWVPALLFVLGLAVFALAMRWDAADTQRRHRHSDVAFWLHLLAAPMVVHPVFSWIGVATGQTHLLQAVIVVALYLGIALISLAIDRRALMVSSLFYVLYTFSALLKGYGAVSLSFAVTALTIGSALLLLSAFWHASRERVLRVLPASLQRRLPVSR